MPDDMTNVHVGVWSDSLSDEDGNFETPITLSLEASSNYTSQGVSLTFDDNADDYPTSVNVKWYRGATLLDEKDFTPDSSVYFFSNLVQNYNKIVMEFNSMNKPFRRLRIHKFDFGIIRTFRNKELSDGVKVVQEQSPISNELSINTLDFKLVVNDNANYLFQKKQPLDTYVDNQLVGRFFVNKGEKEGKFKYKIEAEDYVSALDSVYFNGGVYSNKSVATLIQEIFTVANVPYELDGTPLVNTVSGYIPYTTCREALRQVLFATGLVIDTSNIDYVKIENVDLTTSVKTYTEDDIITGQSIKSNQTLTSVELDEHYYNANSSTASSVLYDASKQGACTNYVITFSEPYHSLTVSSGTLNSYGDNWANITFSSASGTLSGKRYEHNVSSKTIYNDNINVNDLANDIKVTDATLISSNNSSLICQRVFDYYNNQKETTVKIAGFTNNLGDRITLDNDEIGEAMSGNIESIEYSLNNGYLPEIKIH